MLLRSAKVGHCSIQFHNMLTVHEYIAIISIYLMRCKKCMMYAILILFLWNLVEASCLALLFLLHNKGRQEDLLKMTILFHFEG